MEYVGMTCATTFINTSLPALDRSFSFQIANSFANFSFSLWFFDIIILYSCIIG